MAFIEKTDPVVLNIRLTTKGRELLSTGNLSFKYFAIGDSEIDYEFDEATGLNPFNANILRPADNNPNIISFVPQNISGDPYNVISSIPASTYLVTNNAGSIGFFNITTGVTTFIVDGNHIKQPDAMINTSGVVGGTTLSLVKAPSYGTSGAEPAVGDLLLVKWTVNRDTTGYTVNKTYPTPYLIYKIETIFGTLAANTLVVTVDRKVPNFTGMGATARAGAMILYNYLNFSGSTIFNESSTDYLDESVLTFLRNSQCPTVIFPFWNMSIIFTDEIAGVQLGNKTYAEFNTKGYGGFVSYIQSQQPYYKKLGVIHYTNDSPANVYAEGFYLNTAVLDVPTIMWHKNSIPKLGATFIAASGNGYTIINLGIHYYNLVDATNPTVIVGKIFDELKMFLIEDQELLYAMSYKSNRSWTLPQFLLGGDNGGCPPIPPIPVIVLPIVITNTITSIAYVSATGGGNVTDNGNGTVTARGVVWSTNQNPTIADSKTTDGLDTGTYISSMTGLIAGTTYYVRAYATNEAGTAYGTQMSFKTGTPPPPSTATLPTVATGGAGSITENTATGGGVIINDGGAAIIVSGIVWSTSPNPTTANSKTTDTNNIVGVNFTDLMTGLAASTTYYVGVYATNSVGTAYDGQSTFTTSAAAPIVTLPTLTTDVITSIDKNIATGGGNVISDGGATISARGVVWSTNQNPTITDSKTIDGSGTGTFISALTGLVASTTYYVRAYATNSAGTGYGVQVSFMTITPAVPNVTTMTPHDITAQYAGGGGNITSIGSSIITAHGVVWDTTINPTVSLSTKSNEGSGTIGAFTSLIGDNNYLNPNTLYHVRAYATNIEGTNYGDDLTFTTLSTPVLSLNEIINIENNSAQANGFITSIGGTPITISGMVWDTNTNPTIALTTKTTNGSLVVGALTGNITGLAGATTYHVRAYATNSVGTSYSNELNFTTITLPQITVSAFITHSSTSTTFGGTVTNEGSSAAFERGVVWGSNADPTIICNCVTGNGSGLGGYQAIMNGLTSHATYHVRGYACNTGGIGYSEDTDWINPM